VSGHGAHCDVPQRRYDKIAKIMQPGKPEVGDVNIGIDRACRSNASLPQLRPTGVRSLSRSFLPVAGQWVAASGLSTMAFDSGARDGSQNDFSSCGAGIAGYRSAGRTCALYL